MNDKRIILYQNSNMTARVDVNCERIEEVFPNMFHIHGWRDDRVVQVYGGPGVIVEFEEEGRDNL